MCSSDLGETPDGVYVEICELADHPWYLGCQFHPEFKSKPLEPHPLFRSFIGAALEYRRRKSEGGEFERGGDPGTQPARGRRQAVLFVPAAHGPALTVSAAETVPAVVLSEANSRVDCVDDLIVRVLAKPS